MTLPESRPESDTGRADSNGATSYISISERTLLLKAGRAENAEQRYDREHQLATKLQTAMLPAALPRFDAMTLDAVYAPAGSIVGGDWYDAFRLDSDRVVFAIGDVEGHGAHIAPVMVTLRHSLRALSLVEQSPAGILTLLDTLLRSEKSGIGATVLVAQFDTRARTLRYASAGHPPALLRSANGSVRELNGTGAPLGIRESDEPLDEIVDISHDSLLVFYTDGLIESTRDIEEGEALLRDAVRRFPGGTGDDFAHTLHRELLPGECDDDVAILTVRFE